MSGQDDLAGQARRHGAGAFDIEGIDDNEPVPLLEPLLPEAPVRSGEPFMLAMPIDVRGGALAVTATVASIYFIHWAAPVLIPITLSILFAYALAPLVDRLERWRLPRWAASSTVLMSLLVLFCWSGWQLTAQVDAFADMLPRVVEKVRDFSARDKDTQGSLDKLSAAAAELQQVAEATTAPATLQPESKPVEVVVKQAGFSVRDYVLSGTLGVATALGQATMVFFLTLFILASGKTFRRKLVRLAGDTLSEKKITVEVLDEISVQIQRFLIVQLVTSVMVGVALGFAFWPMGVEYPLVWALVATILHLIPYLGAVLTTGLAMAVAFVQFGSVDMVLAVGGVSLLVHTVIGQLLTPWLTSRTSTLNPVVVFAGVLVWGWLWGMWGLLLGIPIMMAIKSVCDRVEDLRAVGELLGNN